MYIGIDGNELICPPGSALVSLPIIFSTHLFQLDKANTYYIYLKQPPLPDMPKAGNHWHYRVFGPTKLWTKFALPFHLYTDGLKLDLFYYPAIIHPGFHLFRLFPPFTIWGIYPRRSIYQKDFYQLTRWTKTIPQTGQAYYRCLSIHQR